MKEIDLWDPFGFRKRRRRFLDEFFPSLSEGRGFFPKGNREPLLDVVERDKDVQVLVELPGVDKKDIAINVEEDNIAIGAEQKEGVKEEDKKKGYFYQERSYQRFYRKLPLPAVIIPDRSKAEFKNGILEITLEKKTPTKPERKGFKVEVE